MADEQASKLSSSALHTNVTRLDDIEIQTGDTVDDTEDRSFNEVCKLQPCE